MYLILFSLVCVNLNLIIGKKISNFEHSFFNNFCELQRLGLITDENLYLEGNWTSSNNSKRSYDNVKFGQKKPLFLTPYIKASKLVDARMKSLVGKPFHHYISYSGFLTVDESVNSNVFFWFFPCNVPDLHTPLIIWLEGSSMQASSFRVFDVTGPYTLENGKLMPREDGRLIDNYNVLYIDCPVGVGYSFTHTEYGYSRTSIRVAVQLFEALQQFVTMFQEMKSVDMYLIAELYASKFIVDLANLIITSGQSLKALFRPVGLLIGNGFVDPINMISISSTLYHLGVVDIQTQHDLKKLEDDIVRQIRSRHWLTATRKYRSLMHKTRQFGFQHPYDISKPTIKIEDKRIVKFLSRPAVRAALHVGQLRYKDVHSSYCYLEEDFFRSLADNITSILHSFKILFYTGQFGLEVNAPKMDTFIRNLEWKEAIRFGKLKPAAWYVNDTLIGFVKPTTRLIQVVLMNFSTIDFTDRPEHLLFLWDAFIKGETFPTATN